MTSPQYSMTMVCLGTSDMTYRPQPWISDRRTRTRSSSGLLFSVRYSEDKEAPERAEPPADAALSSRDATRAANADGLTGEDTHTCM